MPNRKTRSQTFPLSKLLNNRPKKYQRHEDENELLIGQNDHATAQIDSSPTEDSTTKQTTLNTLKSKLSGLSKYQHLDSQADTYSSTEKAIKTFSSDLSEPNSNKAWELLHTLLQLMINKKSKGFSRELSESCNQLLRLCHKAFTPPTTTQGPGCTSNPRSMFKAQGGPSPMQVFKIIKLLGEKKFDERKIIRSIFEMSTPSNNNKKKSQATIETSQPRMNQWATL